MSKANAQTCMQQRHVASALIPSCPLQGAQALRAFFVRKRAIPKSSSLPHGVTDASTQPNPSGQKDAHCILQKHSREVRIWPQSVASCPEPRPQSSHCPSPRQTWRGPVCPTKNYQNKKQPTHPPNQPNQPTSQPANQPTSQPTNQPTKPTRTAQHS